MPVTVPLVRESGVYAGPMTHAQTTLVLLALGCLTPTAAAQQVTDRDRYVASTSTAKRIAAVVERSEAIGFSGTVLAAWKGRVVFAGGVGLADARSGARNTANTLFEIASASKPFTAIAVCRLAEAGKLELDDPLAEHIEGVPENCRKITLRHLLQHTSGIPGSNAQGGGEDLAKLVPFFLHGGPRHEPGSHWEYWNQGYAILAGVIEKASGKTFTEHMRRDVFRRAKLEHTCFTGDPRPEGSFVAFGQASRGPDRSALDHPYGSFGYQYRGMGGVVTNVWDLWRLDRAIAKGKLLEKASLAEMFEPGLSDYGLGWFVRDVPAKPSGNKTLKEHRHTGSVRGFLADVRRYPTVAGCVFVLCNRDDGPVTRVASMVSATLRGFELTDLPDALDKQIAAEMEGVFRSKDRVEILIRQQGTTTHFSVHWGNEVGPEGKKISRWNLGSITKGKKKHVVAHTGTSSLHLSIKRDAAGKVDGFTMDERMFDRLH